MVERWNANSPDISIVFEINETANWIKKNKFTKVGLQFPDELLGISVVICRQLNSIVTDCLCVILGDSSFASCCVDEIAGQHMKINALIHYGRACLSETTGRLPVYYVFGKYSPCQLHNEIQSFKQISHQLIQTILSYSETTTPTTPPILLIMYDFRFKAIAQYIYKELVSMSTTTTTTTTATSNSSSSHSPNLLPKLIWSEPYIHTLDHSVIESSDNMNNSWIRCGRLLIPYQFDLDTLNNNNKHSWMMLYIGHTKENDNDLLSVYRILLCLPEIGPLKTILFDPISCDLDLSGLQLNRLLKRRSYLIEKAKDAQYIGILVCTLSIKHYQHIIDRLKSLLHYAKRSCITLIVGRLNPEKLANLPELQLLILIACPETSLLDSNDFHIPVITPFEMECAIRSCYMNEYLSIDERTWTAEKLWVDFHDLLPGGRAYIPLENVIPQVTESFAIVSLINGHSHLIPENKPHSDSDHGKDNSQSLIVRSSGELIDFSQWNLNSRRTWYGLDPKIGQTPIAQIKDGRTGLPIQYTDEKNVLSSD
ncbi:unnamed protein product [Schistosoma rodhaini]|uniref:2-(3-amino-3-carboxypropyl)histidine synthase subunit 2 n=1 Tax=Schistosoma mansoni TaxID=6183 RepID=A0A3Q0KTD6_SCHMA|nr:unnamed protein product [Schistosoma rodhaini]